MIQAQKEKKNVQMVIAAAFAILMVLLLISAALKESADKKAAMKDYNPNLLISVDSSEKLGNEYQGEEAEEGYSFYRLGLTVRNVGRANADSPYTYQLDFTGGDVLGIRSYNEINYENPFSKGSVPSIPSGMTVKTGQVVQVANGVGEITGTLENRYTQKKESYKIQLD